TGSTGVFTAGGKPPYFRVGPSNLRGLLFSFFLEMIKERRAVWGFAFTPASRRPPLAPPGAPNQTAVVRATTPGREAGLDALDSIYETHHETGPSAVTADDFPFRSFHLDIYFSRRLGF